MRHMKSGVQNRGIQNKYKTQVIQISEWDHEDKKKPLKIILDLNLASCWVKSSKAEGLLKCFFENL